MDTLLKEELGCTFVKSFGYGGGGCINEGQCFDTDKGKLFVKMNKKSGSRVMFEGEMAGLVSMERASIVRVPHPIKVLDDPRGKGSLLIMEFLEMSSLGSFGAKLGEQLANLHLYNQRLESKQHSEENFVGRSQGNERDSEQAVVYVELFGFDVPTCCGYIPQDNHWQSDWVTFYAQNKLEPQLDMIEKEYHDSEARHFRPLLIRKLPEFFKDIDIKPSLLHGDLWGGNAAQIETAPVIFDPASFYGHHEFDLAIASMFGGFPGAFWSAYHKVIPKAPGFETRNRLYQLFHYLNHWNHFGSGYKSSSISIMRSLVK